MPFYTMNELLAIDPAADWCIGHFNVHNYTTLGGVIRAAEETRSPAILALGAQAYRHIGMENIIALCRSAAEQSSGKFALHVDHARDLKLIGKALRLGVSSVMFDGSSLPFKDNIRMTREMVQMAHDYGASAEGEVGEVPMPGGSRDDIMYTDPDQAAEFAEKTGVDFLAVSLGSIHGMKTSSMDLDQELLKKLRSIGVPLVLHGASGVTEDAIRKATRNGLRKININTALKGAAVSRIRERLAQDPDCDLLPLLESGREGVRALAAHYMELFGSAGRLEGCRVSENTLPEHMLQGE
ncbi:MAG: class II fructose-bisphosphate aldolase family protein [Mailhella sp.]|nr:class II fructose-bisphosphate aldolase family protein [Mailhella sp.]